MQTGTNKQEKRSWVRRRWRRIAVIAALVALLLSIAPTLVVWIWGGSMVEGILEEALGARVSIDGVSGGWIGDFELHGVSVQDPGATDASARLSLLSAREVTTDIDLVDLLLSDDSIQISLRSPKLRLRLGRSGRLNLLRLGQGDSAEGKGELPAWRVELTISDGQVFLPEDPNPYNLTLGASFDGQLGSLKSRMRVERRDAGHLEVDLVMQGIADPAGFVIEGVLAANDFDLEPWHHLAGPMASEEFEGVISRARVEVARGPSGRTAVSAEVDVRDFHAWQTDSRLDQRLQQVSLRMRGALDGDRVDFEELSVEGLRGSLALQRSGWVEIAGPRVAGDLEARVRVHDAGELARLLAIYDLIPDDITAAGPLALDATFGGEIAADAERSWKEWFDETRATVSVDLSQLGLPSVEVRDLHVRGGLSDGALTLSEAAMQVLEGGLELSGSLPLTDGHADAALVWRTTRAIEIDTPLDEVTTLQASVTGDGRLRYHAEGLQTDARVLLKRLRLEDRGAEPLQYDLQDGELAVEALWRDRQRQLSIPKLTLEGPGTSVRIDDGLLDLDATPPHASGSFVVMAPASAVDWIDSDVPPREGPVHATGRVDIPLEGDALVDGLISGDARLSAMTLEGQRVTDVSGRITVTKGVVTIGDARGSIAGGTVGGKVTLPVRHPGAANEFGITTEGIAFAPVLEIVGLGDLVSSVTGSLTGSGNISMTGGGVKAGFDLKASDLLVTLEEDEITRLSTCGLTGTVGTTQAGGWSVSEGRITSPGLDATISRIESQPAAGGRELRFAGSIDSDGEWLSSSLSSWIPEDIALRGRSRIDFDGTSLAADRLDSYMGRITIRQQAVGTPVTELEQLELDAGIEKGVLSVTRMQANALSGRVEGTGRIALVEARDVPGEFRLTLHDLAARIQETVSGSPDELSRVTTARATGEVSAQRSAAGLWEFSTGLAIRDAQRRLERGDEVLESAKLDGELSLRARMSAAPDFRTLEGSDIQISGPSASANLKRLKVVQLPEALDISGEGALIIGEKARDFALLGVDLRPLQIRSGFSAWADWDVRIDADGVLALKHVTASTRLDISSFVIDKQAGQNLHVECALNRGNLTIASDSRAELGQGKITLTRPANFTLLGPQYFFSVGLQAADVHMVSGSGQGLALVNPLLLSEEERPQDGLTCTLDLGFDLRGMYERRRGWSRSVNGKGHLKLSDGEIVGSSVISGLAVKAPLALTNVPSNVVGMLTGQGGGPGAALSGMAEKGYHFRAFETPLYIKEGTLTARPDLEMKSSEMGITLNGHVTLEGNVDYHLKTDLVSRMRLKAVTDLPGHVPILGGIFRAVNPLQVLDSLEMAATITGNMFEKKPDGSSGIDVEVGFGK